MLSFVQRRRNRPSSWINAFIPASAGASVHRHTLRIFLGLILLAPLALHVLGLITLDSIAHLDRIGYDNQVRASMVREADPRIAIVDIDDASLARVGRWPWGRDVMATLVEKLFDRYGARLVGFDLVFAEPDHSSGLPVLDRLARGALQSDELFKNTLDGMRASLDNDARFAAALRGRPVVLGFYVSNDVDTRTHGMLPAPLLTQSAFGGRTVELLNWRGYNANLPLFQKEAAGAGHFNQLPDSDGISRRVPLLVDHGGQIHGALGLAIVQALEGGASITPKFRDSVDTRAGVSRLESLRIGELRIPVDDRASVLVPFRGPRGSFRYYSAVDLLGDRVDPGGLKDQIVIVGTSAPGLFDLRATPVANVFPGVEIHANLVSGILDQRIKQGAAARPSWEPIAFILAGLMLAVIVPFLGPVRAVLLCAVVTAVLIGYAAFAWSGWNRFIALGAPLAMVAGLLGLNVLFGYFTETRARRHMAQLFGEYVPPALVDQMAQNPEKYSGEARSEVLTVLFADLRGFTSLAESLDPAHLRQLLNEYFTDVTHVIHEHRGTVDKYIGDGVMAFWGAPIADPDHARNAVRAALALQVTVRRIRDRLPFLKEMPLAVGGGLNTGLVSVGDMGSRLRREYTVIGDPVNLAARLESLTKYYGVAIIIGARTRELVPEMVCRELDRVRVKGKAEAVSIFEPFGLPGDVPAQRHDELKLWNQMLRSFRSRDWDHAEMTLILLQRRHGSSPLYQLYASRIAQFREVAPPADWDGVTTFNRK